MAFKELGPAEFARSSAAKLGRLVAQRRVSPVQLAECAITLAKKFEPAVNAYVMFLEAYARKGATAREAEARKGQLRSPLHGVPIAIKDNFYLKGFPATRGSRTSTEYVPDTNSPMIERMLEAGVVIIGKTTMPEFGWKGTGISPLSGVTRNPWDTTRNSGGSSAGSAVTVATGAVPIALGSDAGGSIRIPAAFCGTVGLKPTLGRIPVWPGTVTETLSHQGPLCRTVGDAALVLRASAGPDARDPLSYNSAANADPARQRRLRAGALRIGVAASLFGVQVDDEVSAVFARAVSRLKRSVKGAYKNTTIDAELPYESFETLWVTGRGLGFAELIAKHGAKMDQGLARLDGLAKDYAVADYFKAIGDRRKFVSAACAVLERFDVLVTPTMPLLPFDADKEVPAGGDASVPLPWIGWTPFTYPFNLSGQPAISIPCGFTAGGIPVGLQIVGPWGQDDLVLAVARSFEACLAEATPRLPPLVMQALKATDGKLGKK